MNTRSIRGFRVPSQGYVCLSCRLHFLSSKRAQTSRHQHKIPPVNDGGFQDPASVPTDAETVGENTHRSHVWGIIEGFMPGWKEPPARDKKDENIKEAQQHTKESSAGSEAIQPNADKKLSVLEEKFLAQRRKDLLDFQARKSSKAVDGNAITPPSSDLPPSKSAKSKARDERAKRRLAKELSKAVDGNASTPRTSGLPPSKSAKSKAREERAKRRLAKEPRVERAKRKASKSEAQDNEKTRNNNTEQNIGNKLKDEEIQAKPKSNREKKAEEKSIEAPAPSKLKVVGAKGKSTKDSCVSGKGRKESKADVKGASLERKQSLSEAKRKVELAERLKPMVRMIKGTKDAPSRAYLREHPNILKTWSTDDLVRLAEGTADARVSKAVADLNLRKELIEKIFSKEGIVRKIVSDSLTWKKSASTKEISDVEGFESLATALDGTAVSAKAISNIEKAHAAELEILPVDVDQPPVPSLSYGLERVLFNPGVYQLQDPRSRVYNFDPYLQRIMPVADFDFNALKEYITSSKDEPLKKIAKKHGKRYVGSTSSMTGALAHFHFLLSQWRPINTSMLSKTFPTPISSFTELQRTPSAIFLRWKDGSYAIDADKQFASANVLSMLGKSMEKLLTLSTEEYERYRRSSPGQVTDEEQTAPESYHYSTMGDFLMRSQLDAHDPRLPGTGMFDLKTRAVVSIRMEVNNYEHGLGYQIRSRQGEWESYEREYYDLIRAAFLKYSMQVRMGRMDGIFVAFHNIERIFGFQYISLPEMDSTIHGQWDTSVGDQEFKLSLDLLNKILDKATKKFPETSLRIHFETRDAHTPFMYVFAEPVTEEQVAEVQSQNEEKIREFERNILGLTHGEDIEGQDTQEDDSKWEDIQASVQEAMDKDELSLDNHAEDSETNDEASEEADAESYRHEVTDEGPLFVGKEGDVEDIDMIATAAGVDEEEDDKNQEEGQLLRDGEDQDEERHEGENDEEEVEEGAEDENEDGREEQRGEENLLEDDVELQEKAEYIDDSQADHPGSVQNAAAACEDSINGAQVPPNVESSHVTASEAGGGTSTIIEEHPASVDENPGTPPENDRSPGTEAEPCTAQDTSTLQNDNQDFATEADRPFLDSIDQENTQADSQSTSSDILAMTLTLRNKVNGKFVLRPENLTAKDKWSIEYSLVEVSTQMRAQALYRACQQRRKKKLDAPMMAEDAEVITGYLRNLRNISTKGKKWREEQDKMDSKRPVQVLGQAMETGGGEGSLVEQEPDA